MIKVTANRPERNDATFAGTSGALTGGIILGKGALDRKEILQTALHNAKALRPTNKEAAKTIISDARGVKLPYGKAALAAGGMAGGIYGGAKLYDHLIGNNGVTASEVPHIKVIACGSSCKPTKKKKKVNKSK